jgi:N-acetylneuraminic acid mutarotase
MLLRPLLVAVATLMLLSAAPSMAHFPWLMSDDEGRVLLYFAESPHETDYHMPDTVAKAVVTLHATDAEPQQLKLEAVETDEFIGRKSEPGVVDTGLVTTVCNYGNYHGTLLAYYVKHYAGEAAAALQSEPENPPKDFEVDVRPTLLDNGISLAVTRGGKPVAGASVTVIDPAGEQASKESGDDGTAKFYNLAKGTLGFTIGVTEEAAGEVDGEKYTSKSHYVTLTLDSAKGDGADARHSALPPLPEPVASFGAAVLDDMVYVYGGHTGTAHAHSRENLSRHFCRIPLSGGQWESLPMGEPLQGFPLVPYDDKIYRVGGMYATNAPKAEEQLHSVDTFAVFDPNAKEWTELAPLPEPRSSHDAVVIDGWLYVVGGWKLDGSSEGQWHETAWKIDLADPQKWQPVANPPFCRRALATSHTENLLVAIGGIDDAGAISRRVDALDLDTGEWKELAELPGDGMHGFGMSAWNHEGKLYASGSEGEVYSLDVQQNEWRSMATHNDRRFFHRLLPAGENRLLMIGGASMEREAHVADSEWVDLTGGA